MDSSSLPSHPKSSNDDRGQKKTPSKGELLSSAKLVATAAKSTFGKEKEKIDKGKVAGATADLISAASHYGKLEEKSLGKYAHKVEDFLQNYSTSHLPTPTPTVSTSGDHRHDHSSDNSQSENKYGEYLKKAEGLLKKH